MESIPAFLHKVGITHDEIMVLLFMDLTFLSISTFMWRHSLLEVAPEYVESLTPVVDESDHHAMARVNLVLEINMKFLTKVLRDNNCNTGTVCGFVAPPSMQAVPF